MSVIEGLRRIQKYWPDVTLKISFEERPDLTHQRLRQIAAGPEPRDLIDLIHRMDDAGLGVRGNLIVPFD